MSCIEVTDTKLTNFNDTLKNFSTQFALGYVGSNQLEKTQRLESENKIYLQFTFVTYILQL